MIANDVIKSVRYILSDMTSSRWTDERLLELLNDGLIDIAKRTILFTDYLFVAIVNNLVEYDLSEWATKIVRVEYDDKELPLTSHNEMDKKYPLWQTVKGDKLKAYLLDKQREAHFKVYPIPENTLYSNIDFSGNYGIITGVTYSELELSITGTFGDLGEIAEDGYLKVYYIRKHPVVNLLEDTLHVSSVAKELLVHYIAGRAFRDNQDTQNRILGGEELSTYEKQVQDYSIERSKSYSQAQHRVPYSPIGE